MRWFWKSDDRLTDRCERIRISFVVKEGGCGGRGGLSARCLRSIRWLGLGDSGANMHVHVYNVFGSI